MSMIRIKRLGYVAGSVLLLAALVWPGQTVAQARGETVLRAISWAAKGNADNRIFEIFIDRINEAGKGIVRIDYVGGPEVIAVPNQVDAVGKGIVDIAHNYNTHSSVVPESATYSISELTPAEERKSGYYDIIVESHKKMNVFPLVRMQTNAGFFIYSKKKIDTLDGLKGLKIRSHALYDTLLKPLGMATIHMPFSEAYGALERGVIDAAPYTIHGGDLGLQQVAKFLLDEVFWQSGTAWVYFNSGKWNGLSKEGQAVFNQVVTKLEADMAGIFEENNQKSRKLLKDAGVEFVKFKDPADRKKYYETVQTGFWEFAGKSMTPERTAQVKASMTRK